MKWTKIDESQWRRDADDARVWWLWRPGKRPVWRAEHGDGTAVVNAAGRRRSWRHADSAMRALDSNHATEAPS